MGEPDPAGGVMSDGASLLYDRDLERSLIAVALHDFGKVLAMDLNAADFAGSEARMIWELAEKVHAAGLAVTHAAIVASAPTPAHSRELAPLLAGYRATVPPDPGRLRSLRRLREVREHAMRAAALAETGDMDGAVAALDASQTAAVAKAGQEAVLDDGELCRRFTERLVTGADSSRRVELGMDMFTRAVGPLVVGSMSVVAADTNVGKTQYALALMTGTAARGTKCGFISCEDPEDVVTPRVIASFSRVLSPRELQIGKFTSRGLMEDLDGSMIAMSDALQGRLMFGFAVGGSELDVCSLMSRMAAKGCRVVCVDYVQAVEPSKKLQDRRNEVRWISSRLKAHANRLGVALLLISQISRPPKGDEAREPTKHDLKESGDLSNAAEAIVVLWRDEESDGAEITCKLAKSKIGHVGATWKIARGANAKLSEVESSYRSAEESYGQKRSFKSGRGGRA